MTTTYCNHWGSWRAPGDENAPTVPCTDVSHECDRSWQSDCAGDLVARTTAGGSSTETCEKHYDALMTELADVGQRYPEIYHLDGCLCYGCSEGSY